MTKKIDYRNLPPITPTEFKEIEKPEKFSQSLLAKWDTCHRSAFLYLKHKGGPATHPLIRGSVFHHFVQETTQYLESVQEHSIPGDVAKDRMMALIASGELVDTDDQGKKRRLAINLPEYEQDALRVMAWNWAESTMIDPQHVVGIEQMIEMRVGDHIVRGKLDLAQLNPLGYGEVDDYKTSLSIPKQDEIENGAKGFQLKFYAALLLFGKPAGEDFGLGAGIDRVLARLLYPRYRNSETGALIGREIMLSRTDLNDFMQSLAAHLDGLERAFKTRKFQATDGAHCSECPARQDCPLPDHLHAYPRIENEEQAIEQAKFIDFTATDVRRAKKALRDWQDENGVEALPFNDDYAYAFRVQHSRQWDKVDQTKPVDVDKVPVTTSTVFDKRKLKPEEKAA